MVGFTMHKVKVKRLETDINELNTKREMNENIYWRHQNIRLQALKEKKVNRNVNGVPQSQAAANP